MQCFVCRLLKAPYHVLLFVLICAGADDEERIPPPAHILTEDAWVGECDTPVRMKRISS